MIAKKNEKRIGHATTNDYIQYILHRNLPKICWGKPQQRPKILKKLAKLS